MSFAQQVADSEFDKLDREFLEIGQRAGYNPLPAAEVIAIQEGRRGAPEGKPHGYRGPVTRTAERPARSEQPTPFRTPVSPARQAAREAAREEELPERARADAGREARRRNTVRINVAVEPICVEDEATGEEWEIPLRRVPSLQHGYVDAAYVRLERSRAKKNRITGRTPKDLRELDRAVGEYNDALREFLVLQVDCDVDELFDRFDIAELDAIMTIVAERNGGQRARYQAGDGDE